MRRYSCAPPVGAFSFVFSAWNVQAMKAVKPGESRAGVPPAPVFVPDTLPEACRESPAAGVVWAGETPGLILSCCARTRSRCTRRTSDRKSTRLNSSHLVISYAVFCLKKKKNDVIYCYYYH